MEAPFCMIENRVGIRKAYEAGRKKKLLTNKHCKKERKGKKNRKKKNERNRH
jgi:hypothetical protein